MAAPQAAQETPGTMLLQHTLPNGLQILGQQMPDLESIAVSYYVRTGARDEHDPALYGVSHFLEHMVFKGTARRNAEQITLDFNRMGAEYNAFTSHEQTVYYARVLGEYLPQAMDLLSDMMRPRLDAEDFGLEKNVIIEEIARSEDQPSNQAARKFMATYFAGQPLAHEVLGTRESIRNLRVEQMRDYHARRYASNNLILSIAGNFRWQEVLDLASERTELWQSGEQGRIAESYQPARSTEKVYVRPQQNQQFLFLGTPSVSMQDPDLYAAQLMGMVLGDSTGSRIYWNIYQKGLADSAGAGVSPMDGTGVLEAGVSTAPEHAAPVLELLHAELQSMQEDGVQEDELRRAKDKLISHVVLDGESAYSRMRDLAYTWVAEHRLRTIEEEMAEIEKVTVADVRRVLDRFPLTDRQVLTAYGPVSAAALGLPAEAEVSSAAEADEEAE